MHSGLFTTEVMRQRGGGGVGQKGIYEQPVMVPKQEMVCDIYLEVL